MSSLMGSVATALDSSVQSQGVKVNFRDWLDMGPENWSATPDRVKAAAYQAVLVNGWTKRGLISIMLNEFGPRVDEDTAKFTLECLEDFAKEHPFEIINEKKEHKD